eukprot:3724995-Rhodomonas_salina.1
MPDARSVPCQEQYHALAQYRTLHASIRQLSTAHCMLGAAEYAGSVPCHEQYHTLAQYHARSGAVPYAAAVPHICKLSTTHTAQQEPQHTLWQYRTFVRGRTSEEVGDPCAVVFSGGVRSFLARKHYQDAPDLDHLSASGIVLGCPRPGPFKSVRSTTSLRSRPAPDTSVRSTTRMLQTWAGQQRTQKTAFGVHVGLALWFLVFGFRSVRASGVPLAYARPGPHKRVTRNGWG